MTEVCNAKYYTLNLIPKYHHDYITLKLQWFIELLHLEDCDWPMDCIKFLEKIKASQLITFEYNFSELPDNFDAITQYVPQYNLYIMVINSNKVKYPFHYSQDRRLNFTVAHEFGHIALDHLLVPRTAKTEDEKNLEEIEADEFAGRFLMPEKLLYSCNYYSLDSAANHFRVSKTALWKRLNNMKKLNLLHSRTTKACCNCGNTKFSLFAEYCGICGTPLENNLTGIQRIHYPEKIKMDRYKRVIECPVCHAEHFTGDKCSSCGIYIFNFCTDYFNENGDCNYANPSNSRFCEMCGKATYFNKIGLLDI